MFKSRIQTTLFASQIMDLRSLLPWVRIRRQKQALRGIMDQRRRVYSKEEVERDSERIIAKIERLPWFEQASTILLYYPVHHEVDLRALLTKYLGKKTLLLPIAHRRRMEVRPYEGEELMKRGRFGIPEPQTLPYSGPIDLIIVPGVAFDSKCRRLGHGRGYYDRFLKKVPAHKVGVCFDFQVYKKDIPHTFLDKPMDLVLTPTKTIGE